MPGMEGRVSKFSIYRSHDEKSLPEGHTCYNQLDLPVYKTKEILVEKMMWAIREAQGFGFGWSDQIIINNQIYNNCNH